MVSPGYKMVQRQRLKNGENKRKWERSYQNNSGQQNKRQEVMSAYTVGLDNKNGYVGKLPLYNKHKLHHNGPCTIKCNNCKRTGHMARDFRTVEMKEMEVMEELVGKHLFLVDEKQFWTLTWLQ
ncbi:reverse transcriptase domain-containing protein, partial [Tanacetum coccineum]